MSKNSTAVMATKESNKPLMLAVSIMIFIALFVANFAKGQSYTDITIAKDPCPVPASGNPCPPPVFQKVQPVVKRMPGTNGAYVECNPNIIINPRSSCDLVSHCGQQYFVPAASNTYSGWDMFTSGAIFFILALFIGLLIGYLLRHHARNGNGGGNGNGGSGGAGGAGGSNTFHFYPPSISHDNPVQPVSTDIFINVTTLKNNFPTWILAKESLVKVGVKNPEQYELLYQKEVKNTEDKKS